MLVYSRKVKNYLAKPCNGRPGDHYNFSGFSESETVCRTNPQRKIRNKVRFSLFVVAGVIRECRWEVFGDPVTIATASWLTQQLTGCEITDAFLVMTAKSPILELGISDELDIRGGCSTVLSAALNALNDCKNCSVPP